MNFPYYCNTIYLIIIIKYVGYLDLDLHGLLSFGILGHDLMNIVDHLCWVPLHTCVWVPWPSCPCVFAI